MDAKLKHQLETTKMICEKLLNGEKFSVRNSEIDCVPHYLNVMSLTKANKKGMALKKGATPVGYWDFQIGATSARGGGDLYLGAKFKTKNGKHNGNERERSELAAQSLINEMNYEK